MLKLYLIRHGESENNKYHNHIVGGISKDTDLTEEGNLQAELLGEKLKKYRDNNMQFDKIFSSTAVRASKTCDIASTIAGYDINAIIKSEKLFETDRGEMVGMRREDVSKFFQDPKINPWIYQPHHGESNKIAGERMYNYLKENLDNFNYEGKVAVYGHGNIFRAFIKTLMKNKPEYQIWDDIRRMSINNTSITHLMYDNNTWHVKNWNDITHLR